MNEIRDERLGSALRRLEVPEHRSDFYGRLREELGRSPSRRRLWLLAPVAAATAILAAGLGLVLSRGSEVASAAEVRAAVQKALSSAESISGVFVNNEAGPAGARGVRWSFVVSSLGSFRITGITNKTDLRYDAVENVEYYSDGPNFVRRVGLAPGSPDSDAADFVVQRGLGSVVAALAAGGNPNVKEVDFQGRSAWVLRTPTGNEGDLRVITVDRGTGIPVRDVLFHGGRFVAEWRIERLNIDEAPTGGFTLEPQAGQQESRYDAGFRRVSLDDVRREVGYAPLVPDRLPAGYALAEVGVAQSSRPTGDEQGQNPPSHRVVSLSYRRGLDEIVVTTRLTGPKAARWKDPVLASSLLTTRPEQLRFASGALTGSPGELVIDPNSVPHIWAATPKLVVTVAGNVSREELLQVAQSLKPR